MDKINTKKAGTAVVVGASLSGLMTGIALAKEGIQVTIVDKVSETPRSGSGLQVEGSVVHHSLKGEDIPPEIIRDLTDQVKDDWSDPWKSAMLHALENRNLTGIPIKEYVPDQLVKGRIALVGDAAHVPEPITASGFNASLQDAVDLGKCVAKGIEGNAAVKALKKYESLRLTKVRKIVESGKSYSRAFGLAGR